MESKKNEFEPTEIAEHLKGNVKVEIDFGNIPPIGFGRWTSDIVYTVREYERLVRIAVSTVKVRPARQPRLKTLIVWNDLLPSPGLRKQTAKMLADQQAHITGLQAKGRHAAARWQVCCSYGLWAWYIAARPVSMLVKTLMGKFGGT
ncbi:MAG: hypothetical protein IPL11_16105 [Candidatus Accumulibacter sp.]|nr:hypothetical protein [Accumulibacter sp.]